MDTQQINLKNLDKSTWQSYRFDQIAKNISERVDPNNTDLKVYIGLEHIDSDSIHIKRTGTPDDVDGQKLRCYPGDVIFGRRRAYQRKAAIAKMDGFCSAHALVLRANPDVIEPKLFPFFLHSDLFMHRAIDISVGSLSPTINWGTLKHQEFQLPLKDQQARLAELLWAMDEVIEKDIGVLEKLDGLSTSVSVNSFDYGYQAGVQQLPKSWKIMKVKDFSTVQAGSTPLRSNNEFFDGGTIPWLKTLDLNNDRIYKTEECITEIAIQKTSCKLRPIDTILVAMYGGFNQIGRTGLLKIEAATNQAVSAIMVDKSMIKPEYLLYVLNTKIDYWKKVAVSSRKDPNITKNDVENFPVPIPPLNIQVELINKAQRILDSSYRIKAKIKSSKYLQKSLINQIF
jgi:type I restriction enzyme, S subunit